MDTNIHLDRLKIALRLAENCKSVPYFGVGAVIFDQYGNELSASYTNEIPGCHAEEGAIRKANDVGKNIKNTLIYSTLEPCSHRLSGNTPCVTRIIESGISSVFYGCREPDDFVDCKGGEILSAAGIVVVQLMELQDECLRSIVASRA